MNCISVLPHVSNKKVKFSMFSIIFALLGFQNSPIGLMTCFSLKESKPQ